MLAGRQCLGENASGIADLPGLFPDCGGRNREYPKRLTAFSNHKRRRPALFEMEFCAGREPGGVKKGEFQGVERNIWGVLDIASDCSASQGDKLFLVLEGGAI